MKQGIFLLLLLVAAVFSAPVVDLKIKESAGVSRISEDITMGVPLPENGAYTDASMFTLRDANGSILPCEIKSVCTWWKNPACIRWLQLNFPFSLAAGDSAVVTLHSEASSYALASNLTVQDQGAYFEVNTGKIRFYVKKSGFNLIDQAWVDESGLEDYTSANKVVETHARGFLYYKDTVEYASSNDTASTVTLERKGPGLVCLKATGQLVSAGG